MAKAIYFEGLTVEGDEFPPRLTVDGRPVEGLSLDENGALVVSSQPERTFSSLQELGQHIVRSSPSLMERRREVRESHIAELKKGVAHWNQWRLAHPGVRPLLFGLDLKADAIGLVDLNGIDFANANLIATDLRGRDLISANFHEANLGGAQLCGANLTGANFCRTDLYATDLSDANLMGANLQGTQLAMTILDRAQLVGCKIYGMSAWDVSMEGTVQKDLAIVYKKGISDGEQGARSIEESTFSVDGIEAAQFVYLMMNNPKISPAIDALSSKVVLILGRFSKERKAALDRVRDELRRLNYVPVLFDFSQPDSRSVTDTVKLLAQISLFVIADLTDPGSSPFELANIYRATPVIQTIILSSQEPFGMFWDLVAEAPALVLKPFSYRDVAHLTANLEEMVVAPALAAARARAETSAQARQLREAWRSERR